MIAASKNCEDPTLEVNLKFYIYNQEKRVINLNNALKNKSVEEKKEVILDLLKKCDEKEQRDPSVRGPSVRGPSYRTPIPFSVQGIKLSFLKLDKGSPGVKYLVMGMHGHGKSTFINAINLLQYSIYPKLNLQQNIDRLYNGLSTSKFYGICAMVGTKGTVYRRSDYTCPNPSKDLSEEQVNDDFKKITFKVKTDRNENPTTVFPYTHRVKFNDDAGSAYDMIFIDTPGLRFETCSVEEQLLHYIYHLEEASKKAEFPFNHFLFVVEDTFIRDGRITTLLNPLKRILHEDTFKKAVGSKCISFVVTTKQPQSFTESYKNIKNVLTPEIYETLTEFGEVYFFDNSWFNEIAYAAKYDRASLNPNINCLEIVLNEYNRFKANYEKSKYNEIKFRQYIRDIELDENKIKS